MAGSNLVLQESALVLNDGSVFVYTQMEAISIIHRAKRGRHFHGWKNDPHLSLAPSSVSGLRSGVGVTRFPFLVRAVSVGFHESQETSPPLGENDLRHILDVGVAVVSQVVRELEHVLDDRRLPHRLAGVQALAFELPPGELLGVRVGVEPIENVGLGQFPRLVRLLRRNVERGMPRVLRHACVLGILPRERAGVGSGPAQIFVVRRW